MEIARGFHGIWREVRKALSLLVRWLRAAWGHRRTSRPAVTPAPLPAPE
ncbi:MAG: hypothetical protein IT330_12165 [Anaerolineae bacterium]|nr:hypothetical protein [Anaerolineae bacterium]